MTHGRLIDLTHLLLLSGDGEAGIADALARMISPASAKDVLNTGDEEGGAIRAALAEAADALAAEHDTVRQIVTALYRLHPTQERLLLREAELATQTGVRAEGRDRTEHLKDAHGLLRRVADNPVSGRDYTLRFNLAWLAWQLGHPLPEVEDGFYQAARLSASTAPPFHAYALRHQAHLQYLQKKPDAAYETAQKALSVDPDGLNARYEAARYAARIGRVEEAQELLERCFLGSLIYLLYASAEEDFETSSGSIPALIAGTVERARRDLERALRAWRGALRLAREAEERSGVALPLVGLTEEDHAAAEERYTVLSRRNPFGVASLHREVYEKPELALTQTDEWLALAADARQAESTRLRRQLQKLVDDVELWNASLEQLEEEARVRGYVLRADVGVPTLLFMTKKQQRIQQARVSYISCLQNLDAAERHYAEQSPGLESAIGDVESRLARIRTALTWFREQTAPAPAAEA